MSKDDDETHLFSMMREEQGAKRLGYDITRLIDHNVNKLKSWYNETLSSIFFGLFLLSFDSIHFLLLDNDVSSFSRSHHDEDCLHSTLSIFQYDHLIIF